MVVPRNRAIGRWGRDAHPGLFAKVEKKWRPSAVQFEREEALERLLAIATSSDTGLARRVADFLLAWPVERG